MNSSDDYSPSFDKQKLPTTISDFYKDIYKDSDENVKDFVSCLHQLSLQCLDGKIMEFTMEDLDAAVLKAKCNKASDHDGVQAEFLKLLAEKEKITLLFLLNQKFKGVLKKQVCWFQSYCALIP